MISCRSVTLIFILLLNHVIIIIHQLLLLVHHLLLPFVHLAFDSYINAEDLLHLFACSRPFPQLLLSSQPDLISIGCDLGDGLLSPLGDRHAIDSQVIKDLTLESIE